MAKRVCHCRIEGRHKKKKPGPKRKYTRHHKKGRKKSRR